MRLLICILTSVLLVNAVDLSNEISIQYEKVPFPHESHIISLATEKYSLQKTSTPNTTAVKIDIYTYFNNFKWENTPYTFWLDGQCPMPPSQYFPDEYAFVTAYGKDAIPHLLQYIIDSTPEYYAEDHGTSKMLMILSIAYEILGVTNKVDWIDSTAEFDDAGYICSGHGFHIHAYAEELQNYIAENGYKSIYPFATTQDAALRKDYVIRQLMLTDFAWKLSSDLETYESYSHLITQYGSYAVPHILDYILSHENKALTPDEEMNLGVLLHLCYRMLGVETTAEWHMPAEAVESTTDPFPYTHALMEHLGEYGLTSVP